MASSYDVQTWLLDRANIHDTVTKMSLYVDMSKFDELAAEVLNEELVVDYTAMFGGEPSTTEGPALAAKWKDQVGHLDAKHHVATSILINLPQPGNGVAIPTKSSYIANTLVTLQRKDARGGPETKNGVSTSPSPVTGGLIVTAAGVM